MKQVTFESLINMRGCDARPVMKGIFTVLPRIELVEISTSEIIKVWRIQKGFVCIVGRTGLCRMSDFRFPTLEDYYKKPTE